MSDVKIKPICEFQAQGRMECNTTYVKFNETINLVTTDVSVIPL